MQLAAALLCDAASVRENLLNVLGGGISMMRRGPTFPAALNVELALVLSIHPSELSDSHQLRVEVNGADGEVIANIDGHFGPAQVVGTRPTSDVLQPIVLPLRNVGVPSAGRYAVEISVDKAHLRSLSFEVTDVQQPLFGAPPGG